MQTMLIVDDDPAWRELYAAEFKPRFRLLEAADGLEALGVLERTQPDVIVLDLRLPRLNGLDFLRALDRLGLKIPVVVCSALVPEDGVFSIPGVRAAQKNADLQHLRTAVEEALAGHAATPVPGRSRPDRR
jgi:CheY-like chemotaxis protein